MGAAARFSKTLRKLFLFGLARKASFLCHALVFLVISGACLCSNGCHCSTSGRSSKPRRGTTKLHERADEMIEQSYSQVTATLSTVARIAPEHEWARDA